MNRRQFLVSMSLTGASAALAACAPKAEPTAAPAPAASAPTAPAAAEPVKEQVVIQLHHRAGGEKSEAPIYVDRPGEFMEENPDIKVELAPIPGSEYQTKILTMAAAKTLGDVMWTSDVWTDHTRYVKSGILAVVDDWLSANDHPKTEWLPACVDTLTHDGKMYGLPKCSHPGDAYIWINEDAFEEAGIAVPETFGSSIDDLPVWAEQLAKGTEKDRSVYGYRAKVSSNMAIYGPLRQFGGIELNEEGTESMADSDEWYAYTSFTGELFRKNLVPVEDAIPSGGIEAMFAAGKVAMVHSARSTQKRIKLAMEEAGEPFNWKVIQFPRCANPNGWTACVDTHSAIATSEHLDEAQKLSYAMADPRFTYLVASQIGYMGGRTDDAETVKDLVTEDPFLSLQAACGPEEQKFNQPANARGKEVETILKNELSKIWLGTEELTRDFMKELKGKMDEVLAKPF